FFSSRRRHTRFSRDWSSDVCSSDLMHTPPDPGKEFEGRTLRIFAVGHAFEDLAIWWLRRARFDLRTQARNGGQFGFETAGGRIRSEERRVGKEGGERGA